LNRSNRAMPSEPRYPQVLLDIATDQADEAGALLFELGAEGVEERDDTTLASGPGKGIVTLVASFADAATADEAAAALDPAWSPRRDELVGDAWRDEWKKHFVPFQLTERITIRPPWETYEPRDASEIVLDLEPGRAFGTGLHATTSLVASALEARAARLRDVELLDVGTGSGILALIALSLGAIKARAIDIDPDSIEVTVENAVRNGLRDRIEADTTPVEEIAGAYAIVSANIELRVLVPMAPALTARVRPEGTLILSGILRDQESEVRRAFEHFEVEEILRRDEWIALVLRRLAD
jgi:ribosomal protein L11 methyltransferase